MAATTNLMSVKPMSTIASKSTSSSTVQRINNIKYKNLTNNKSFDNVFSRTKENISQYKSSVQNDLPDRNDPISVAVRASAQGKSNKTQDAPQKELQSTDPNNNDSELEELEDDEPRSSQNSVQMLTLFSFAEVDIQNVDVEDIAAPTKSNLMTLLPQSSEVTTKNQNMLDLLSDQAWKINSNEELKINASESKPVQNDVIVTKPESLVNSALKEIDLTQLGNNRPLELEVNNLDLESKLQSQPGVDLQRNDLIKLGNNQPLELEVNNVKSEPQNQSNFVLQQNDLTRLGNNQPLELEVNDVRSEPQNQPNVDLQPNGIAQVGNKQPLELEVNNVGAEPQNQPSVDLQPQNDLIRLTNNQPLKPEINNLGLESESQNESNIDLKTVNPELTKVPILESNSNDSEIKPLVQQESVLANNDKSQIQTQQTPNSEQMQPSQQAQNRLEAQPQKLELEPERITSDDKPLVNENSESKASLNAQIQSSKAQDLNVTQPSNQQQTQITYQPRVNAGLVEKTTVEANIINSSKNVELNLIDNRELKTTNQQPTQNILAEQVAPSKQVEIIEVSQVQTNTTENQLADKQQLNPNTINNVQTEDINSNDTPKIIPQQDTKDQQSQQNLQQSQTQQQTMTHSSEGGEQAPTQSPVESFSTQIGEAFNNLNTNQNILQAEQNQSAAQLRQDFNVPTQIVEQARLIRSAQNTEMVINLKPEHLGQLTLKVSVNANGSVNASFHTDNAQVRAIIENSLVHLKNELANQGLKVESVQVYAGLSDGGMMNGKGQQAWQNNQQQRGNHTRSGRIDVSRLTEEAVETSAAINENNSEDGVDYRV